MSVRERPLNVIRRYPLEMTRHHRAVALERAAAEVLLVRKGVL